MRRGLARFLRQKRVNQPRSAFSEQLEDRVLLAADPIRVNFQPDSQVDANAYPELAGYLADDGDAYGNRGDGFVYGWLDGNLNPDNQRQTRNRNNANAADERYDTLNHFIKGDSHSWQIALENGEYELEIVAGDPSHTDQVNDLLVISGNNELALDDPDGQDQWDEYTVSQFEVTNGLLRITPADTGSNQKIAFVIITPLDVAEPELPIVQDLPAANITPFSADLAGQVVFDGNDPPAIRIFYGTTDQGTSMAGWDDSLNVGVQSEAYGGAIENLIPNTTYYFRSLAGNLAGFVWGSETLQFSTLPIQTASVVNSEAKNVEAFSATVGGEVTDTGNEVPSITLFWGDEDGGTNPDSWDHVIELGSQGSAFEVDLANLTHNTDYYFRSRATNAGGAEWAPTTATFSTLDVSAPSIESQSVLDIEAFQALITGSVGETGNDDPQVQLYWGKTDGGTNAGNWDYVVDLGPSAEFFSTTLVGLEHDTNYFFRARATNLAGSRWFNATSNFKTLKVTPATVANAPAARIGSTSAELNGNVADYGNDPPIVTMFYGTQDGGASAANWQHSIEVGQEISAFAATVRDLESETTYYFRARATNFAGTSWAPTSETFVTEKTPTVLLTEFMASNESTLTTRIRSTPGGELGDAFAPDWVEIHNPGDQTVDLSGLFLTDDSDNLQRWKIPAGTELSPGGFLLVMASGEDIIDPALDSNGYLHTNFKLSTSGEFLAIVDANGNVIHGYTPSFPGQSTDFSYGIDDDGNPQFYSGVTPGAANGDGTVNFVEDTTFSVDRGFYDESFQLQITSQTPGATIVYTTDGSEPSQSNGTKVNAPQADSPAIATLDIETTTLVRAYAYKTGFESTNVDTHSYIFLSDVLNQATNPSNGRQVTPEGFPTSWGGATGDYQVDPDIVNHARPSDRLVPEDLKSVATISVVMDNDDLFGDNQIYLSGSGSPRAASIEMITADGSEEFQLNGSIQVQGGSSTNRWKDFKLSLRLKFQAPFGPSKLNHALYEDSTIDANDNVILDGVLNHAWVHSGQHNMPQYIQDQYVADLHNEMGGSSPYGRFAHLYLNGLYWGMYYVHDRPDHAWAAQKFGGDKSEYHAVKHSGSNVINNGNGESARSSYNAMVSAANAVQNNPNDLDRWSDLQERLDVDNFITYLLANWFTGNHDWPHKNWYATAHVDGPWRFHSWDAEHATDSNNDVGESPSDLHGKLDGNDEYLIRMADFIHQHFFNDGVLTADSTSELWKERMDEIDRAIVGESARWGDNRSSTAHTREDWLRYNGENGGLLQRYFPTRSRTVLGQLRSAGLYPSLDAPEFNQHGGGISSGFQLQIDNPDNNGTIYVTTDGSDPRLIGGDLNGDAVATDRMTLNQTTTIKARIKNGSTWSALTEATFYVNTPAVGDISVTEINYNPHASLPQFGETVVDAARYEFLEIKNTSNRALDLAGLRLTETNEDGRIDGIGFEFGSQILAAGQHVVVVKDLAAFQDRYGDSAKIAVGPDGEPAVFDGQLNNGGETLTLLGSDGSVLQSFRFNDGGSWPGRADGRGSSLELISPSTDLSVSNSWRSSGEFGGSPGYDGEGPSDDVVINEILTHTDLPLVDAIELHNSTGAPINVANWYVSDSGADYFRYRIPGPSKVIAAGGYLTIDETQLGFGFKGEQSDDAWLIAADSNGVPIRFMDHVNFGATQNGISLGRWPDGNGRLFPMSSNSFGQTNSGPLLEGLIISEVSYHPAEPGGGLTKADTEFVEIWNPTSQPINLGDWRLNEGVDYDFDSGMILGPSDGVVVVSFDPSDATKTAAFRSEYQISSSVKIVGPYRGVLDNGSDRIELERPEDPAQLGLGFVLVDRVVYGRYDTLANVRGWTGCCLASN